MFHYTRLERLASDKHSKLLGQLVSKEENERLRIRPLATTLSIMIFSNAKLYRDTQHIHNDTQQSGTRYTELLRCLSFMLRFANKPFMLSDVMLSVIMLTVIAQQKIGDIFTLLSCF